MKRYLFARFVVAAGLLASCGQPGEDSSWAAFDAGLDAASAADFGDGRDSGTTDDAGVVDAGLPDSGMADAGAADAGAADAGADESRPMRVTVRLVGGRLAQGEIVAVYDRTRWWNPGPGGLVYAIFDPSRYATDVADRSFTFVSSDEVEEIVAMEPVTTSYQEFLSRKGFEFVRSPFGRPAYVVMGNDGYHLDEDGFGDFAFDLQVTDEDGRRFQGDGSQNVDHYVWDEPTVAPIGGTIFETYDDQVDNVPGSYPEGAPNNLVGIGLGGNFYAYLLHFRQDAVEPGLTPGTPVSPGDRLGRMGNSGVTLEPHLHLVLLWYDPVLDRSYSVPVRFAEIEVAPTPIGPWRVVEGSIPDTGVWIR